VLSSHYSTFVYRSSPSYRYLYSPENLAKSRIAATECAIMHMPSLEAFLKTHAQHDRAFFKILHSIPADPVEFGPGGIRRFGNPDAARLRFESGKLVLPPGRHAACKSTPCATMENAVENNTSWPMLQIVASTSRCFLVKL
jgi:hypothetical protein